MVWSMKEFNFFQLSIDNLRTLVTVSPQGISTELRLNNKYSLCVKLKKLILINGQNNF